MDMDDYVIETFSLPSEARPLPCSCQTCNEATFEPFIFDYTNVAQEEALPETEEPEITMEKSIEEVFSF